MTMMNTKGQIRMELNDCCASTAVLEKEKKKKGEGTK